jgi:hypothetical protein
MEQDIRQVASGQAERICVPGQWKVWRDDAGVHIEVLS